MIVPIRIACFAWWVAASMMVVDAVAGRDWHLLVVQMAESLIALVLWFSVESDSDRLRAPRVGTRGRRLALYAVTLLSILAAFASWQWPFRNAAVSPIDFVAMLFGILLIGRFFATDWKRQVTP